ncbi:Esterase [Arthrobotrys entomopaga]|nr:Esterase [Arthrobotrys entomopaga]
MAFQPALSKEDALSLNSETSKPSAADASAHGIPNQKQKSKLRLQTFRLPTLGLKRKVKGTHHNHSTDGATSPPRSLSRAHVKTSKSRSKSLVNKNPKLKEPDRPISIDNPSIFACFMDASPSALVKLLVPRLPLMGKTVAWHTLGLSTTSPYWDLKTELAIAMMRSLVALPKPGPISKSQHISLKDPGIKGRMWIAKVPVPAPTGPETRQYVIDAIDSLVEGDKFDWAKPELSAVSGEWTGYRANVAKDAPQLDISEEEKYKKMMEEVTSPVTVYYIHGGAMYLMDPATHRPTVTRLAKGTKGRAFSLRYRLAPQNPFPAALMDALLGYLYLLYPPPGALHEPVDPKNIVICGDSAGGNLVASLLALILTLRRLYPEGIIHNGAKVDLPLPAGVGLNSPWADITHSFPSVVTNKDFDYIPSPAIYPPTGPEYPTCAIWPVDPPRKMIYVEDKLRLHPLVNPVAFKNWEGAPPVLIMAGQEILSDECKFLAKNMESKGVTVRYEEYQAMPHCFALVIDWLPVTAKCFGTWCGFIEDVVEGREVVNKATRTLAKSLKEEDLKIGELIGYSYEEVLERMKASVEQGNSFHKTLPTLVTAKL